MNLASHRDYLFSWRTQKLIRVWLPWWRYPFFNRRKMLYTVKLEMLSASIISLCFIPFYIREKQEKARDSSSVLAVKSFGLNFFNSFKILLRHRQIRYIRPANENPLNKPSMSFAQLKSIDNENEFMLWSVFYCALLFSYSMFCTSDNKC